MGQGAEDKFQCCGEREDKLNGTRMGVGVLEDMDGVHLGVSYLLGGN